MAEAPVQPGGNSSLPRAVVIDAVVLTPALDRLNARLGIEQAVTGAIREAGWDPVSITTDCKDLGCAGAAASTANASYAIVLTGRFVKQETYVADIGVSLSRDGSLVASRSETEEEADAHRSGTVFLACGPPSGTCTTKLLTAKLQRYTSTLLDNENVRSRIRRRISETAVPEPIPPVHESVPAPTPALSTAPPAAPQPSPPPGRRWLGWALVGVGVAAGVGSVIAWSKNDELTDCDATAAGDPAPCRRQRNTLVPAISLGAAAAGALTGGAIVLFRSRTRRGDVAVSLHPSGVSLGGRF
jgi:hypothetical protein